MSRYFRFSLFTFLLVCTLICVAVAVASRPAPPASLAIQIVGKNIQVNPTSCFHVVLTNQSDSNIRLWEEGNSWGYFNLTFDIVDSKGKSVGTIQKMSRIWTMNVPSHLELAPNQHHVIDVDLLNFQWNVPIEPSDDGEAPPDYRLVARYSTNEGAESLGNAVWTGAIQSNPVDVKLEIGSWPKSK